MIWNTDMTTGSDSCYWTQLDPRLREAQFACISFICLQRDPDQKGLSHQQHPQTRIQSAGLEWIDVETCLSWVHRKKTHESRVPRLYRHTHVCSSFGVCVENVRAHLQMCRGTHAQACVCSRKSANSKANSGRRYHQWHQQSVTERRREDVHCLNTVWLNSSVQLQRIQHFNSGMTRSAGSADLFCIILRYHAQNYNLEILF